ncbi:glycosyltransferase family 2 protein [Vibrio sp. 10N.261.51.A4]|uniref:glycosyltransferase family 2 protein n=1 Tax=Vibrio sp. 10N.261.51.A4 TaxID=3229674 RepID=UPI00354CF3D7
MNKYKYTIIIPSFNSSETIINCLESCLSQSFENYEIVIVDDCSTDNSCSLIEAYIAKNNLHLKIKLIKLCENNGPANARNIGVEVSNSDYIALLDSDDSFYKEKLLIIDRILTEDSSIDLIGHAYSVNEIIDNDGSSKVQEINLISLLFRNFAVTPSVVFRKDIATRFDASLRYTEDHDFFLRVKSDGYVIKYLDLPLVRLNRPVLSSGGLSSNKLQMRRGEMKMLTKFCTSRIKYLPLLPFLLLFSLLKHVVNFVKAVVA